MRGTANTRWTSSRSPDGSSTRPAPSLRATTPVLTSTPAQRSSSATAWLACSPNSDSGSCSGVTTMTLTSDWPISFASPAVISASSYAGSGQHRARRDDDREPLGVALLEVAQQPAVALGVAAREPRGRAVDAGHRPAAGRQQQRVEAAGPAAREPDLAGGVVGADDAVEHQLRAGVVREARERHAVGMAEAERLGHRERPVREVRVGRDSVRRARSPRARCSASSASSPATPPPAMTISMAPDDSPQSSTRWCSSAYRTSSAREERRVFCWMCARCDSTVRTLRCSVLAISLLVWPSAIRRRTDSSRSDRSSGGPAGSGGAAASRAPSVGLR